MFYKTYKFDIAPKATHRLNAYGNFLSILENNLSLTTPVQVAIGDGQAVAEIDKGISVELPQPQKFNYVTFYNPHTTATMQIKAAISEGRVYDNRLILTSEISLLDVSNFIDSNVPFVAQEKNYLIDNAAAVDKGGGLVGIPVTAQPFWVGALITITNTVNYNGDYTVNAVSANEVTITHAYVAETFDGTDDRIGLRSASRKIDGFSTQKELMLYNHNASYKVYVGDQAVDATTKAGFPIDPASALILSTTATIYLMAETGAGKSGCQVSWVRMTL